MSLFAVLLSAFPFKSKIFRFVSQNGVVNLYMFLLAYFFEPYSHDDFSYENNEIEENL